MSQWLGDPIFQSVVAPLLVAAILSGLLGFGFGRSLGRRIAAAAIPSGFLASYWATIGWPAFPPVASNQKIFYLVVFGAVIGLVFDLIRRADKMRWIGPIAWSGAIAGWMGWRMITTPSFSGVATIGALWLAGATVIFALRETRGNDFAPAVMLLIGAIGLSLIALIGSSASFAQLSGGLAAATGGFMLWNWPKARFSFGWAGVFGGAGALFSLIGALILFTNASKLGLFLILPMFFADRLAVRLPLATHPAFAPFVLAVVCLVPVVLAVLVAYLSGGGSGYAFNMDLSH